MDEVCIFCTFQVPGLHQWLGTHSYLKHPHRHVFHFRVEMSVSELDREVEFIAWKQELEVFVRETILPGYVVEKACEHMATELLDRLEKYYPMRGYKVEVSEDGENGAKVSRDRRPCG